MFVIEFSCHKRQENHIRRNCKACNERKRSEYLLTGRYVGGITQLAEDSGVDFYSSTHTAENERKREDKQRLIFKNHTDTLEKADFFGVFRSSDNSFFNFKEQENEE